MRAESWLSRMGDLLAQLRTQDFGYPVGPNVILPPQPESIVQQSLLESGLERASSIRDFYLCCDGLSLPDVHNGYFIKQVTSLPVAEAESEPQELQGPISGRILVVGSTGGGGLFACHRRTIAVFYLPPGPLHLGVYDSGRAGVRQVAADWDSFLDVLLGDVEAFVTNRQDHRFTA
jgi:hypothetical protein